MVKLSLQWSGTSRISTNNSFRSIEYGVMVTS